MNEEVQKMIDHTFEYAQELLIDTKEFYPFGAYIDTIGNVHPLEFDFNPKKMPTVGIVLDSLTKYCETEMAADKMRAYALAFEADIKLSEDQDSKACIGVNLFHVDETDLPDLFMPYLADESGNLTFDSIFGVKSEG